VRLVLTAGETRVICRDAPTVELLREREVAHHRALSQLGPDLSRADVDLDQAVARLRALGDAPIADALLDQRAAAGIGNVYKSEVLFLCGVSPTAPVSSFGDSELRRALTVASKLLRKNRRGRRTTRFASDGPKLWVYDRTGEPCLRCGERIQSLRQGELARMTYFCPSCQG
jgi:endonuclease-8